MNEEEELLGLPETSKNNYVEYGTLFTFAKNIKAKRLAWGLTQDQMGSLVKQRFGVEFSQTTISRFEALEIPVPSANKMYRLLTTFLEEAENVVEEGMGPEQIMNVLKNTMELNAVVTATVPMKQRKKRTSFTEQELRALEFMYDDYPRPTSLQIEYFAKALNLNRNTVRVWFCNRRQKARRGKEEDDMISNATAVAVSNKKFELRLEQVQLIIKCGINAQPSPDAAADMDLKSELMDCENKPRDESTNNDKLSDLEVPVVKEEMNEADE